MNSRNIRYGAALLVTFLTLGGCARIPIENGPSPEPTVFPTEAVAAVEALPSQPTTPSEPISVVTEAAGSETLERAQVTEVWSSYPMVIDQVDRSDVELASTDSVSYLVMIRPDDYLGKIAVREYDNPGKWRSIYRWNRELIGADPNVIHPYHELELFKPEQEITDWSYEYIIHAVVQGETLWSIAKDWYGDNLAWVTIYADNEDLFSTNKGRLSPGMELKIRTSLVGPPSDDQRVSSGATPDF